MNNLKKSMAVVLLLGVCSLSPESQTFVKKKRGGPSVTECCDAGVDVLASSADLVAEIGKLQQQLIVISKEMIDNNKKCYLASANKEQLKNYYDKTQACKDMLDAMHSQVNSYTEYIKALE